jgi:hypothetical protein
VLPQRSQRSGAGAGQGLDQFGVLPVGIGRADTALDPVPEEGKLGGGLLKGSQ